VLNAGAINGRVPLNPGVASRRFSDRAVTNIPRSGATPQVASRGAGAASPAAQSGYHRFGEPGTASQGARPPQAAGNNQRPGSLQRFGEPGSSGAAPRNDRSPSSQNGNAGWKTFGTPGTATPGRQPYNPPQLNRPGGTTGGSGNSQPRQAPAPAAPKAAPAPSRAPAPHAPPRGDKHR
jgi:hypothetical protein